MALLWVNVGTDSKLGRVMSKEFGKEHHVETFNLAYSNQSNHMKIFIFKD